MGPSLLENYHESAYIFSTATLRYQDIRVVSSTGYESIAWKSCLKNNTKTKGNTSWPCLVHDSSYVSSCLVYLVNNGKSNT